MLLVAFGLMTTLARAENWGQWRGPLFNGSSPETNLPVNWSATENVRWTAPLPGYSGATPVVWDDSVFVVSPDDQQNLLLLCVDRLTGKIRWQSIVGPGDRDKGRNNMASPSPVTDGKSVFALFGTGDLAAFEFAGRQLWVRHFAKEYGRFSVNWLYGSSPLLYRGRLYVQVLQRNPPHYSEAQDNRPDRESFLLCLDPATGSNVWRQLRPSDALGESQESYATPIPTEDAGRAEILLVGGDVTTAHDPDTGAELWRCGWLNMSKAPYWRVVPSPVVADGLVIACAPQHHPVFAIKNGGHGLVTETNTAWVLRDLTSDCATPLYYEGKLFILDGDRQILTCLNPKTGDKIWQGNLGVREIFRGSPTGADGKIYCIGENGTAVVASAGDEFKVLSTISMSEEPVRSSIAVSHGELFIRTAKNLYCIGAR